ncbi:MAG: CpsD/CapB family tyrosine-protein kinase [Hahellaceae bacterium]|nr:CpsD/CapB family tyrosine-protein kinase [Hahellaceae bacterium]
MDRITKAIEMANKTRVGKTSGTNLIAGLDFAKVRRVEISRDLLEANKVVAGLLTNPVSEYYRMLRTRVLRVMEQNNWKVIGVTGPSVDAGKSLTATNLAVAIAMEPNHAALLVDADLRKPAIGNLLGITPKAGLGEFISGAASIEDVMVCPGVDRLGVIMNTQHLYGSSDVLMGNAIKDMVEKIKASEDNVVAVFGLPPVFVGDDAVAISSYLDALLIIVNSGHTTRQQLSATMELLKDANIVGCVLNNAPDSECLAQQYGYY